MAAKFQWMTWTVCLAPSAKRTAASRPDAGERPRSRIQAAMPQPASVRCRRVARVSERGPSQGSVSHVVGAKIAACGSATSGYPMWNPRCHQGSSPWRSASATASRTPKKK